MSRLRADFPFHLPGGLSAGGRCPGASTWLAISLPGTTAAQTPLCHERGAITPSLCSPPACTPSSRATNICSQPRQQTAPIRPPSPKSRPDKPGPRLWESLPSHLHGVQLPAHPLVFGGNSLSQSCSPRLMDRGLPRPGHERACTLQPGPTARPMLLSLFWMTCGGTRPQKRAWRWKSKESGPLVSPSAQKQGQDQQHPCQSKLRPKETMGDYLCSAGAHRRFLRMTPRPGALKIALINLPTERENFNL